MVKRIIKLGILPTDFVCKAWSKRNSWNFFTRSNTTLQGERGNDIFPAPAFNNGVLVAIFFMINNLVFLLRLKKLSELLSSTSNLTTLTGTLLGGRGKRSTNYPLCFGASWQKKRTDRTNLSNFVWFLLWILVERFMFLKPKVRRLSIPLALVFLTH